MSRSTQFTNLLLRTKQFMNKQYRIRSDLGLKDSVVISGDELGKIHIWDLLEGKFLLKVDHHDDVAWPKPFTPKHDLGGRISSNVVSCVTFSRTRKEWASAAGDGNLAIVISLGLAANVTSLGSVVVWGKV